MQYRAPRYITLGGFVCAGLAPSQGIIAGCALATTFVKVYTILGCDHLVLVFPLVRFDLFVDDWQVAIDGEEGQVVAQLVQAAELMDDQIQHRLGCSVSAEKAAVVASSNQLARRRRGLRGLGGDGAMVVKNLGIDFSSGRGRSFRANSTTRAKRFSAISRRSKRLRILTSAVGSKAGRISIAGFKPAVGYGMEVWGCSPKELLVLQRRAAACWAPHSKGSSLSAKLIINGDPNAPSGCCCQC